MAPGPVIPVLGTEDPLEELLLGGNVRPKRAPEQRGQEEGERGAADESEPDEKERPAYVLRISAPSVCARGHEGARIHPGHTAKGAEGDDSSEEEEASYAEKQKAAADRDRVMQWHGPARGCSRGGRDHEVTDVENPDTDDTRRRKTILA